MTIRNFIPYTGIFTYPLAMCLFRLIVDGLSEDFIIPSMVQDILVYVVPIIFPLIITITNIERQARGQTDFSFASVYGLGDKNPKHSKEYILILLLIF